MEGSLLMAPHESNHKTSKKFLATLEFSRTWSALILVTLAASGLAHWVNAVALAAGLTSVLLAMVIVLGFVQVLYLGNQTAIDTFVRVAALIASMVTGKVPKAPEPEESP